MLTPHQQRLRTQYIVCAKYFERFPNEKSWADLVKAQTNHRHVWRGRQTEERKRERSCEICFKIKGTRIGTLEDYLDRATSNSQQKP